MSCYKSETSKGGAQLWNQGEGGEGRRSRHGSRFPVGKTWLAGTLRKRQDPLSFSVELDDGQILRRHVDHILQQQKASSTDQESRRLILRVLRSLHQEVAKTLWRETYHRKNHKGNLLFGDQPRDTNNQIDMNLTSC